MEKRLVRIIIVASLAVLGAFSCVMPSVGRQNENSTKQEPLEWKFVAGKRLTYRLQKETIARWRDCCEGYIDRTVCLNLTFELITKKVDNDKNAEVEITFKEVRITIKQNENLYQWDSRKDKERYNLKPKLDEGTMTLCDLMLGAYSGLWRRALKIELSKHGRVKILDDLKQYVTPPEGMLLGEDRPDPLEVLRWEIKELLALLFIELPEEVSSKHWSAEAPLVSMAHWENGYFTEERSFQIVKAQAGTMPGCTSIQVESQVHPVRSKSPTVTATPLVRSSNGVKDFTKDLALNKVKGKGSILFNHQEGYLQEANWQNSIETGSDKDLIRAVITRNVKIK